MDWRQYETEVFEEIVSLYPEAEISFDLKLLGQFSQTKRQCDVVIDERSSGKLVRTLVDAKYRKRKINVKEVEEFVGLLRDVNCDRGIIVAANGFTPAAEKLAFNGHEDVDLDILNLDDLQRFQGETAIPYAGDFGLILRSPLGWITDATKRELSTAFFYQRGLSYEQATQSMEFMYLNFWHLDNTETLDDLIQHQEENLRGVYLDGIHIDYSSKDCGRNGVMRIRQVEFIGADHSEITAFLSFKKNVAFAVVRTPRVKMKKNRRKLIHMLAFALPVNIKNHARKR